MIKLLFVNVLQPLDVYIPQAICIGDEVWTVDWHGVVTVRDRDNASKVLGTIPTDRRGRVSRVLALQQTVWGGGSMQQRSVSLLTCSQSWNLDF